jgi:hypothetical protein
LFTASHTREDGGTSFSNIVSDGTTPNMDLDYDALKALWRVAALVKTPKGKPMPMNPNLILVKQGSAPSFRAKEIQGALKSGKLPGELSNDGSGVPMFELYESPYFLGTGDATSTTNLSSATNWIALDTSKKGDEYGLQYFESQPISLGEQNIVYKTEEIQYKATMAFAYGHNDPRGIFGSTGANA